MFVFPIVSAVKKVKLRILVGEGSESMLSLTFEENSISHISYAKYNKS